MAVSTQIIGSFNLSVINGPSLLNSGLRRGPGTVRGQVTDPAGQPVRATMLLRLPGRPARVVAEPVSVLDALPVVWRAAGWPAHGNFQGRDDVLEPGYDGRRRPLLMTIQGMTHEDGILLGDWKYVVNWDRRRRALFDLAADPDERVDRTDDRPEEAARLDRELARLLALQLGYYRERGWESGRYPPRLP